MIANFSILEYFILSNEYWNKKLKSVSNPFEVFPHFHVQKSDMRNRDFKSSKKRF